MQYVVSQSDVHCLLLLFMTHTCQIINNSEKKEKKVFVNIMQILDYES